MLPRHPPGRQKLVSGPCLRVFTLVVREVRPSRSNDANPLLKALHKEPARRYASAEQLSDDLRRFLERLPVAARTSTVGYRAHKFVRRNISTFERVAMGHT